jgi:hypothetical protein
MKNKEEALCEAFYLMRLTINNINDCEDLLSKEMKRLLLDNKDSYAYKESLKMANDRDFPLIDEALI